MVVAVGSKQAIAVSNAVGASSMWRVAAALVLAGCGVISLNAQTSQTRGCLAREEYAPVLVSNPGSKVTFRCDRASPLDLIRSVGRQSRRPIGVVLGRDPSRLSRPSHSYDVENVDARVALRKAIEGTGYTLKEENHVLVLTAGDLSPRQKDLLFHRYADFVPGKNQTMFELGFFLSISMRQAVDPKPGYAANILSSLNDERFTLEATFPATTEGIANRIVSLGSKGMWIFRVDPTAPPANWTDEVSVEPYQHYSNRPIVQRRTSRVSR